MDCKFTVADFQQLENVLDSFALASGIYGFALGVLFVYLVFIAHEKNNANRHDGQK